MTSARLAPCAKRLGMLVYAALLAGACHRSSDPAAPTVVFTRLPASSEGNPDQLIRIEGRVTGARKGQRIVLYARSGFWWVQPLATEPFTEVNADSHWDNATHPGTAYAALLVNPGYVPPSTIDELPAKGDAVAAVATAAGNMLVSPKPQSLRFSEYDWQIRQTPGNSGGTLNQYEPSNAWIDRMGFLHFRLVKQGSGFTSAQVTLTDSLGYGTYRFVVRDISHLEPSAVLAISIRENAAPYHEADIEFSRWGELTSKNAQFVIQPYYVPENSVRFPAPQGTLVHEIHWEPDHLSFRTALMTGKVIAGHAFASGIPVPGEDSLLLNLYVFGNRRNPLRHETEVVIEKFEFLP